MFGRMNEEFSFSSMILKNQIDESLHNEKIINSKDVKKYDRLTNEYLSYLDNLYSELINNPKIVTPTNYNGEISKKEYVNDLFFMNEKYSSDANDFIDKTNVYRTEILKLIGDKNLIKKVNHTLNTSDFITRDGKKLKNLDFLYKDMPLISVLTHLKRKENAILEIENDYLKIVILEEYQTTANTM